MCKRNKNFRGAADLYIKLNSNMIMCLLPRKISPAGANNYMYKRERERAREREIHFLFNIRLFIYSNNNQCSIGVFTEFLGFNI